MTHEDEAPDTLTIQAGEWEHLRSFLRTRGDTADSHVLVERIIIESDSSTIVITSSDGALEIREREN